MGEELLVLAVWDICRTLCEQRVVAHRQIEILVQVYASGHLAWPCGRDGRGKQRKMGESNESAMSGSLGSESGEAAAKLHNKKWP